jgi:gamma-glutamylcyclotransferase (GGCT)/AIG2-like uncharacterized protein YtfP
MHTQTLFVYGILRDTDTVKHMCPDWQGTLKPAYLFDHITIRDMGPAYTFPCKDAVADGFLLTGLTEEHMEALDFLEGVARRHYDRVPVEVTMVNTDEIVQTEVYLGGPGPQKRWEQRTNPIPPYPGTPEFLPGRIGSDTVPARAFRRQHRRNNKLFIYHPELFSIDRIELIIGHEWVGARIAGDLHNASLSRTFPKILMPGLDEEYVHGYFITGLSDEDLKAIDQWMNIDQQFLKRIKLGEGKDAYYAYIGGERAGELLHRTEQVSKKATRARRKAERARIKHDSTQMVDIDMRTATSTTGSTSVAKLPLVSWQPTKA